MAGEMLVDVILKPHVGTKNSSLGPVEVDLGQWFVVAERDGQKTHVGYMTRKPGAPVLWLDGRFTACQEYGVLMVEAIEKRAAEKRDELLGPAMVDAE